MKDNKNTKAQVFSIHSDFYYVKTEKTVFECKLKEVLKKQKVEVIVGDFVLLENINEKSKQAFISDVFERKTFIPRPKVANINQIIIVSAIKEPELDFNQLNRYLSLSEYYKIKPILCFNKTDLAEDEEIVDVIFSIYEPMGYEIIFTSALEKTNFEDIEEVLEGKVTAMCGLSGVGKSTLINAINPDLKLKTKEISPKTNRGVHTTRHSEIIEVKLSNGKKAKIVDTPGFSYLRFNFLLPKEVDILFPEIAKYNTECKFKDCLHIREKDCAVLKNLGEINISRYKSYLVFVEEAKEYKEKITNQGKKKEEDFKILNDKKYVKINTKKREEARNVFKQELKTQNHE